MMLVGLHHLRMLSVKVVELQKIDIVIDIEIFIFRLFVIGKLFSITFSSYLFSCLQSLHLFFISFPPTLLSSSPPFLPYHFRIWFSFLPSPFPFHLSSPTELQYAISVIILLLCDYVLHPHKVKVVFHTLLEGGLGILLLKIREFIIKCLINVNDIISTT